MTGRVIIWPDKRLIAVAAPVAEITDEVRAIWDRMIAVMEIRRASCRERV